MEATTVNTPPNNLSLYFLFFFLKFVSLVLNNRKIASHLFTTGNLKNFMLETFASHGQELVEVLGRLADKDQVVNMQRMFLRYTFDCISIIAFGKEMNALKNDNAVMNAFDHATKTADSRYRRPWWKVKKKKKEKKRVQFSLKLLFVCLSAVGSGPRDEEEFGNFGCFCIQFDC
jgi:hypothetical protein